jgi:hypothetical protein
VIAGFSSVQSPALRCYSPHRARWALVATSAAFKVMVKASSSLGGSISGSTDCLRGGGARKTGMGRNLHLFGPQGCDGSDVGAPNPWYGARSRF